MAFTSDKRGLEDLITEGIRTHINNVIEQEIAGAVERFENKLRGEVGNVVVRLSKHFHVATHMNEIVITYKEEDKKDASSKS